MWRQICYLNTLHTCFARFVIRIPYINVLSYLLLHIFSHSYQKIVIVFTILLSRNISHDKRNTFLHFPLSNVDTRRCANNFANASVARNKKYPKEEPDANQASVRCQEPQARARRESGQHSRPRATVKSQTRIRPGFEAKSHRQEPDANQARIRGQEPQSRARRESGQDSRPSYIRNALNFVST